MCFWPIAFFLNDCAPCPLSRQCACGEEGRAWPPALPFHPLPLLLPPKGTQGLTRSRTASTVFGATKLLYLKASAVVSFCAGPEHAQGLLSAKLFSLMSFQLTWPFELEVLWPRQVLRSSQSDPSFGLPWTAHGPTPTVGVGRFFIFCSQDLVLDLMTNFVTAAANPGGGQEMGFLRSPGIWVGGGFACGRGARGRRCKCFSAFCVPENRRYMRTAFVRRGSSRASVRKWVLLRGPSSRSSVGWTSRRSGGNAV